MTDSILESVAEVVLGTTGELDAFAPDLITYINSALMSLAQLGVGSEDFRITGTSEVWSDFADESKYGAMREYVTSKVRLAFDPPTSSAALDALTKIKDESEWRLMIQADQVISGDDT
jgi:hypothetical protein